MWGYARFRKTGIIECTFIKGANMTGYPTKGRWVLLKLFLSRRVIFIKATNCRNSLLCLPKHGGDRPFLGSLVAVQLALLGNQLLLLALAHLLGPKLCHFHGVLGLHTHVTCLLRDIVLLLDPGVGSLYENDALA